MNNIFKILSVASIILIAFSNAFADIYMSVDEKGNPFFTNVPSESRFRLLYKERVKIPKSNSFLKEIEAHIRYFSERHEIDYHLVKAVIKVESDFNPNALSYAGAMGLMQLMPETAELLKVNDVFNPRENIDGGVRFLKYLLDKFDGNTALALAAYHAGAERVVRYNNIPPIESTRRFVDDVIRWMLKYQARDNSNGGKADVKK